MELLQVFPLGVGRKVARALKLVRPVGHGQPLQQGLSITAAHRIEQDRTERINRIRSGCELPADGQAVSVKIIARQDVADAGHGIIEIGTDHALLPFIGELIRVCIRGLA